VLLSRCLDVTSKESKERAGCGEARNPGEPHALLELSSQGKDKINRLQRSSSSFSVFAFISSTACSLHRSKPSTNARFTALCTTLPCCFHGPTKKCGPCGRSAGTRAPGAPPNARDALLSRPLKTIMQPHRFFSRASDFNSPLSPDTTVSSEMPAVAIRAPSDMAVQPLESCSLTMVQLRRG